MSTQTTTTELAALKRELDAARERQEDLERTVEDLQERRQGAIDGLADVATISRSEVKKLVSLLGVGGAVVYLASEGALADASTTDSDGDIGSPSNRLDLFADGIDAIDLSVVNDGDGSGLDADRVDGYNVVKNGTDDNGVINFKTP